MKVLYLLHRTGNGGATISFKNMVEGIVIKGVEPVVILPPEVHPNFQTWLDDMRIKSYKISLHDALWPQVTTWRSAIKYPYRLACVINGYLRDIGKIKAVIEEEHPDIVHTNVGVLHCGFYAAHKMNVPHIWHLREYQDKDFAWKIFPSKRHFIKLLRQSYVITITKDILHYFGLTKCTNVDNLPGAKCISNGILPASQTKYIWPKDNYFITANKLVPAKSMETTIRGFAKFLTTHRDYKLIICGEGSECYVNQLKQLAVDCGCAENIDWLGFADNVPDLMSHSRGLIVSSRSEGLGRMTVEACFMGCMPIGRNTGGTKEVIDYTGGILFDKDVELSRCLIGVADMSQEEYKSIVLTAQKRAISEYSNEVSAEKIFDFYKQILGQ